MSNYWDSEEIFLDGDQYFDRLIKDIDEAQNYISIEIYIFNDDSLGHKIAAHLVTAKQRGVQVEIIVDGVGSYGFFRKLHNIFHRWGIQVKIYNPLPFYHPYFGELSFKKKVHALFTRLWRLNSRNHRKIITIDHHILYSGSYNFTEEHTRFHRSTKWKDMGLRVTGDNVKYAVLGFKKIWKIRDYFRYRKQKKISFAKTWDSSTIRMNHSLLLKQTYYRDLLKRINHAHHEVWFMTPYFIPQRGLIKALAKAAQRGADVRLLISAKSDVKIFQTLQLFYYPYLLKKGVKVYHYVDTILHAKNSIIDDWITVGSSNLNHRSLLHDLEIDLVIQDQKNKALIKRDFNNSTQSQLEITNEYLKQRTVFDKFLSRLFFVFKYWF